MPFRVFSAHFSVAVGGRQQCTQASQVPIFGIIRISSFLSPIVACSCAEPVAGGNSHEAEGELLLEGCSAV